MFVPVGLNYDRVLEDRVLTAAAATPKGERPRFAFNPLVLTGFLLRSLWLRAARALASLRLCLRQLRRPDVAARLSRRARRRLCARFPPSARFAEIERLGNELMHEVGRVVPALPVSLVATAILAGGERGLSSLELKGAVFELMEALQGEGAHVHIPRQDQEYAVEVGLRMLLMRHLVLLEDGVYRANPKEEALLRFYANAIAHLLRESRRHQRRRLAAA